MGSIPRARARCRRRRAARRRQRAACSPRICSRPRSASATGSRGKPRRRAAGGGYAARSCARATPPPPTHSGSSPGDGDLVGGDAARDRGGTSRAWIIGLRYRLLRNSLRWRRRGRRSGPSPALPLLVRAGDRGGRRGPVLAVVRRDGSPPPTPDGQAAVLSLVVGAKSCSVRWRRRQRPAGAVVAGSPKTSSLLSRGPGPSLILARSVAGAVVDPLGAVLCSRCWSQQRNRLAAWRLRLEGGKDHRGARAGQCGGARADGEEIAVVRYTPPRGRRVVWVALRAWGALTLAVLWMTGTWILPRAACARRRGRALARDNAWTPGAELVRPLVALRLGGALSRARGLGSRPRGVRPRSR